MTPYSFSSPKMRRSTCAATVGRAVLRQCYGPRDRAGERRATSYHRRCAVPMTRLTSVVRLVPAPACSLARLAVRGHRRPAARPARRSLRVHRRRHGAGRRLRARRPARRREPRAPRRRGRRSRRAPRRRSAADPRSARAALVRRGRARAARDRDGARVPRGAPGSAASGRASRRSAGEDAFELVALDAAERAARPGALEQRDLELVGARACCRRCRAPSRRAGPRRRAPCRAGTGPSARR